MSKTINNFDQIVKTGGDSPAGQGTITAAKALTNLGGRVAVGFMLTVDGEFDYTTPAGDVITDPPGTWQIGVQYAQQMINVAGATTAQGKIFYAN